MDKESENSFLEVSSLNTKDHDKLRGYIRDRLLYSRYYPPLVKSVDELPEDIIIAAIRKSQSKDYLEAIEDAIRIELQDQWQKLVSKKSFNSEYFSRLLALIEVFSMLSCCLIVHEAVSKGTMLLGITTPYLEFDDLCEQAISVLGEIQYGPPGYIEIFKQIIIDTNYYNNNHKLAAFNGLINCSENTGFEGLNLFFKSLELKTLRIAEKHIYKFVYQYTEDNNIFSVKAFINRAKKYFAECRPLYQIFLIHLLCSCKIIKRNGLIDYCKKDTILGDEDTNNKIDSYKRFISSRNLSQLEEFRSELLDFGDQYEWTDENKAMVN